MNSVLGVITFAVAAIGAISLLVGGVGILTIMTMAVTERTGEIGLLRALGARQRQVLALFLGEAILLSAAGGLAGLLLGMGIAQTLHALIPALPVQIPVFFAVLAESSAVLIGLAAVWCQPAAPRAWTRWRRCVPSELKQRLDNAFKLFCAQGAELRSHNFAVAVDNNRIRQSTLDIAMRLAKSIPARSPSSTG